MVTSHALVFIHGLFQNPLAWTAWKTYFEQRGYTCYAPAYPYHEGDPMHLRQQIHPELGNVTLKNVIDHLIQFIDALPEKPILIGHSMGGLLVQKLIEMDKGVAGVCISSAPPKGITTLTWSFIKTNFPVINPLKGNSVFQPSFDWYHDAFCHVMNREASQKLYNQLVVPESRNIPRSSTGKSGRIDFTKAHAPLLFLAGSADRIVPPVLNRKNIAAYTHSTSKRDYKEFAGRSHQLCAQDGWEEIAQYLADWLAK